MSGKEAFEFERRLYAELEEEIELDEMSECGKKLYQAYSEVQELRLYLEKEQSQ